VSFPSREDYVCTQRWVLDLLSHLERADPALLSHLEDQIQLSKAWSASTPSQFDGARVGRSCECEGNNSSLRV